jgi:hypothetical protein
MQNNEIVDALYAQTVYELSSNSLHSWLHKYGNSFSWKEVKNWCSLKHKIKDLGTIGIIIAKGRNDSKGHIAVAYCSKSFLRKKVWMTQAGIQNHIKTKSKWWKEMENANFWYLDDKV